MNRMPEVSLLCRLLRYSNCIKFEAKNLLEMFSLTSARCVLVKAKKFNHIDKYQTLKYTNSIFVALYQTKKPLCVIRKMLSGAPYI